MEIHEANACKDHIHMLVSIPPKLSVSQFMGYLKGKSSLMIFDRHANLNTDMGIESSGVGGILSTQSVEIENRSKSILGISFEKTI